MPAPMLLGSSRCLACLPASTKSRCPPRDSRWLRKSSLSAHATARSSPPRCLLAMLTETVVVTAASGVVRVRYWLRRRLRCWRPSQCGQRCYGRRHYRSQRHGSCRAAGSTHGQRAHRQHRDSAPNRMTPDHLPPTSGPTSPRLSTSIPKLSPIRTASPASRFPSQTRSPRGVWQCSLPRQAVRWAAPLRA